MLDAKLLREHPDLIQTKLAQRGFEFDKTLFESLESQRKTLQTQLQELQNQRNSSAKKIGNAKARGEDINPLLAEVEQLREKLQTTETQFNEIQIKLEDFLAHLPNLPHESVPIGKS